MRPAWRHHLTIGGARRATRERGMYVSQHAFTPAPAKFDQWVPYNRNDMRLSARVPGAVLSRILRLKAEPEKFMAVGVWTSRDVAVQWTESDESKLGSKPSF